MLVVNSLASSSLDFLYPASMQTSGERRPVTNFQSNSFPGRAGYIPPRCIPSLPTCSICSAVYLAEEKDTAGKGLSQCRRENKSLGHIFFWGVS